MENAVLIDYHGNIRYETIGELIHRFKHVVPRYGIPMGIYKRLLLIMIESLENIMKHSETPSSPGDSYSLPALSIIFSNDRYVVASSNHISKLEAQKLKDKIDFLNNLDQQGLKNFYKETITNGVFTKNGGAGLGLIEIAKVSGKPIQYVIQPVNSNYSLYKQEVTVDVR